MKINNNSLINIVETKDYIRHNTESCEKNILVHPKNKLIYEAKIVCYQYNKYRKLILTKKAYKDITENYHVSKDIRFPVLRSLPARQDSILIDENTLLRYIKDDTFLAGTFHYIDEWTKAIKTFFFWMNLEKEIVVMDDYSRVNNKEENMEVFKEKFFSKFMLIITYLELTDIQTEILNPRSSVGTKKTDKFKNETNKQYIIVKSNWNTEKVILTDIHVRGHWRLQPYGVGRSQYKYIFIDAYDKGMTRRAAQKDLVNS